MSKRDGVPAFPTTSPLESWGDPNRGMSMREWYAGMALQGAMVHAPLDWTDTTTGEDDLIRKRIAQDCFAMADEMIKASDE